MLSLRNFKIPLLIGCLALWLAVNNDVLPSPQKLLSSWWPKTATREERTRQREKSAAKKTVEIERALLKQPLRRLGEECSPNTEHCYIISDYITKEGGQLNVARMMVLKKIPQYVFTQVNLKTPEKLNKNVREWPIDKLIVNSVYCQLQISAGFITESMSFDATEKQQVLMIGLGGGVSSNFLSILHEIDIQVETTVVELDPFIIQLAEKYFGHQHVPGVNNVVAADGLVFLKEAVAKGLKYRSLLLDACYNYDETRTGVLCPVTEFLSDETIKNMYDVLEDGGVVTVNTISDYHAYKHEAAAMEAFMKYFPSCYLAPYQSARNMLICSKRENWTWVEQRNRFRTNLKKVIDRFDFGDLKYLYSY